MHGKAYAYAYAYAYPYAYAYAYEYAYVYVYAYAYVYAYPYAYELSSRRLCRPSLEGLGGLWGPCWPGIAKMTKKILPKVGFAR